VQRDRREAAAYRFEKGATEVALRAAAVAVEKGSRVAAATRIRSQVFLRRAKEPDEVGRTLSRCERRAELRDAQIDHPGLFAESDQDVPDVEVGVVEPEVVSAADGSARAHESLTPHAPLHPIARSSAQTRGEAECVLELHRGEEGDRAVSGGRRHRAEDETGRRHAASRSLFMNRHFRDETRPAIRRASQLRRQPSPMQLLHDDEPPVIVPGLEEAASARRPSVA